MDKPNLANPPKGLVYLSIPYSHPSPAVVSERMKNFWIAMARLIDHGVHVISPMTAEPTLQYSNRKGDWDTWQIYCNALMDVSEEIWVLTLDGWDQSSGVEGEIQYAFKHRKPVRYLDLL